LAATSILWWHPSSEPLADAHEARRAAIITGRGAVVRQWGYKFLGLSMVFNFTNIGDKENLAVQNIKWRIRTFFGLRLGKR
jgi:hypothetical protein